MNEGNNKILICIQYDTNETLINTADTVSVRRLGFFTD
jgi:hypothetical protein